MPVRSPLRPSATPPAWSSRGLVMALALAGLIVAVASSTIGTEGALSYVGVVARLVVLVGLIIALAIVLSTLAVAALVQPAWRRVQAPVDPLSRHTLWLHGGGG